MRVRLLRPHRCHSDWVPSIAKTGSDPYGATRREQCGAERYLTDSCCKTMQYPQEDSCSAHQKHYGEKYSYPIILKNTK